MTKTGQQIEDDIFSLLKESELKLFVGGGLYKYGTRPYKSTSEDIIVKFVTALDDEVQEGVVVVNIYVPDIDAHDSGSHIKDIPRCKQIEIKANEWIKSLTADKSDYLFSLSQSIYTEQEADINQHFITVRLKFKILTN